MRKLTTAIGQANAMLTLTKEEKKNFSDRIKREFPVKAGEPATEEQGKLIMLFGCVSNSAKELNQFFRSKLYQLNN